MNWNSTSNRGGSLNSLLAMKTARHNNEALRRAEEKAREENTPEWEEKNVQACLRLYAILGGVEYDRFVDTMGDATTHKGSYDLVTAKLAELDAQATGSRP